MKTEQIIEGIGKAVADTKPSQEYCLFWWDWWPMCMTKAEWSGWMQAIGAVLAILGAFYLSSRQERSDLKRAQKSAVLRVKAFVAAVNAVAKSLNEFERLDEFYIYRQQAYLREMLSAGASISAEVLDAKWILAFESARLIATQLIVVCEAVLKDNDNLPEIYFLLNDYCEHLESVEEVVKGQHPGVILK